MDFQDRVKELRRVPKSELVANPKNWRKHPPAQRKALSSMLRSIGYADALIARETEDGTLELIDGHLRLEVASAGDILPVLVLDVDEDEALQLLLTLDPLAAMAVTDQALLEAARGATDFGAGSDEIEAMLASLRVPTADDGTGTRRTAAPKASMDYNIVFDDQGQQERWFVFLRSLKQRYGDVETAGGRIDRWLQEVLPA